MTTLPIKTYYYLLPSLADGATYIFIHFLAITEIFQEEALVSVGIIGASEDIGASPYPNFTSGEQACMYYATTQAPALLAQVNTDAGYTAFTDYDVEFVDPAVSQAIMNLASVYVTQTTKVNGHALSADVTVSKSDINLGNVDNISDANKPVSTATQTALNAKFATPSGTTVQFLRGDGTAAAISTLNIPSPQIQSDWTQATSSALDYIKNKPTIPSTARTSSALSLSLVGSGATGTQISSTKDSTIRVNLSTSTTATISGPSTSLISLKICATNNATEGSWTTIATLENDQTVTLAVILQSVQVMKGQLCADVPAGWYAKLVNSGSGTHSESFISAQQTIYG